VRRLKESGVIRVIGARLDPAAARFPLHVYGEGLVATAHDGAEEQVALVDQPSLEPLGGPPCSRRDEIAE
jgi:DNA-binding Lrp family transcriptional regulator